MTQDMVLNKKYSKITVLLLLLLTAAGNALAQGGVVVGGNVYGGGNLAPVKENTEVHMSTGTVNGNVFGGGKGKADNFTCDKAMVGIDKDNNGVPIDDGVTLISGSGENAVYELKPGGTTVIITNGTVEGDVFGGGEVGRVERNTIVTIGTEGDESLTPVVKGNVFGAGKGVETHGYSALVRGNSTVTIQGQAHVWKTVHGGGEKASVGRYQVAITQELADQYHVRIGMPCYLKAGGKCTVNIQDDAKVGKDEIGDSGDVYGAGQGVTPVYNNEEGDEDRSKRMVFYSPEAHPNNKIDIEWNYYVDENGEEDRTFVWEYFPTKDAYLLYVETLGRASKTDVVIGGKRETTGESAGTITSSPNAPTIKGTVYGGSESGFVYYSTEVNIKKGTIVGDVFGGGKGLASYSEAGQVRINSNLTVSDGTIKGNVYGGGSLGDVGYISKDFTSYNYLWKKSDGSNSVNTLHNNTITGISNNTGICNVTISGGTIGTGVAISADGTFANGNVYGAGKGLANTFWCEKAMVFATNVNVTAGTVNGTVYGGGEVGRVEDDAKVTIGGGSSGPTIAGNVFGAGAGIQTHGYSALVRGNSTVTVQGTAQVGGCVYGGGEIASVGRFNLDSRRLPKDPLSGGTCKVTINGNAQIGTSGTTHNVFGACKGVEPSNSFSSYNKEFKCMKTFATTPARDTSGEHPSWDYYEDDHTYVWEYFADKAAYLEFLRTLALTSNTDVEISGSASVNGSVYGGGERGITLGKVEVDILGGTVTQDVYGGGALADTNTANWENGAFVSSYPYHEETSISRPSYVEIEVTVGSSVEGLYTQSGDEYAAASGTAVSETQYYEKLLGASTTGLYTRTGTEGNYTYTKITDADATADETTVYFALYTTTVNLLGGTISGNAYGGGLGRFASETESLVEAKVYGETKVNLNGMTVGERNATSASILGLLIDGNGDNDYIDTDDDYYIVNSKGCIVNQVFGCNNQKGSPQGNVTVHVFATQNALKTSVGDKFIHDNIDLNKGTSETDEEYLARLKDIHAKEIVLATALSINTESYQIEESAEASDVKTAINNVIGAINEKTSAEINEVKYDVKAVYGGGNEAAYDPATAYHPTTAATGSKAQVIVEGCEYTSIETVYGGGNAASVPEANVAIKAAYEIGTVFGGGNGKEPTPHYNPNPGADIGTHKNTSNIDVPYGTGNANTLITGGYIHELFGGSNEKGTIMGSVNLHTEAGSACEMLVKKMVTAGKNADIMGDAITVLGCMPDSWVDEYYGGADNANVHGNVELTITSGKFRKVFGGNNASGCIMGHIKLNIEETGNCGTPIIIDELYLSGNEAAYSQYGYYVMTEETEAENGTGVGATTEHALLSDAGKIQLIPRQSDDSHLPVNTYSYSESGVPSWTVFPITGNDKFEGYAAPVLNVISCTNIGKVFGGGLGTGAAIYGNPIVNINMIPGSNASGIPAIMEAKGLDAGDNPNDLGIIGNVYGGGNAANTEGNTTVNICTATTVDMTSLPKVGVVDGNGDPVYEEGTTTQKMAYKTENVLGAYISGNVFGGGMGEAKMTAGTAGEAFLCAKAMVNGNEGTHVNIGNGFVRGNVYGGGEVGRVEHNTEVKIGLDANDIPEGKTSAPVIKGNVFGAGAGVATHGYSALVRGHSTVTVQANSKVEGSIYGGGEKASVGKYKVENGLPVALAPDQVHPNSGYCYVNIQGNAEIGPDDMVMNNTKTGKPDDYGHVFGAGKGVLPYEGYADDKKPFHMNGIKTEDGWDDDPKEYPIYNPDADLDADYTKFIKSLALATQTVVTISGNPFIKGSVYGGSENGYVQKNTHVVISSGQIGNGYVQMTDNGTYLNKLSTPLTPLAVNRRYTDEEWTAGHLIMGTNDRQALKDLVSPGGNPTYYTTSLPECASWPYGQAANEVDRYAPYDREANKTGDLGQYDNGESTKGGRYVGDDGHTFYGNVFGGGSGYYPYRPGKWFKDAGAVYGNTYVTIKGGHILSNIYGGNEMTDVGKYADDDYLNLTSGGSCYVTMIGGTLGVPRTLKQIDAHPVTCYLFGAGKGDQRVFFNKSTNVGNVFVHISDDARIYGSVFGGGEDGHVMKNVTMNIGGSTLPDVYSSTSTDDVLKALNLTATGTKPVTTSEGTITYPYIGTWGTSYVEGNVFGGGRGFGADAYTAGNVAGTVTMNIYGGTMLGSIYGGGRLGSVGYGLFNEGVTGYGEMQEDNTMESYGGAINPLDNFPRGYVYMTIGDDDGNGPTIGNTHEYKFPSASNGPMSDDPTPVPTLPADIKNWTEANWTTWKEYNHVPKTEYDTTNGRLTHTKGGNVFTGGMGRLHQLNGTSYISAIDWWKLGCVKSTTLTIKGGTIKSNVYGGGELGQVVGHHTIQNAANENVDLSTEITIQGSNTVIGTEVKETASEDTPASYTFGSVFGGGYGSLIERIIVNNGTTDVTSYPKYIAGLVKEDTKIDMQDGAVKASIYGGGEMASVGESTTSEGTTTVKGSTYVSVSGGTVGIAPITLSEGSKRYFGGATMGNVYGGGSGSGNTVQSGKILKNSNVTISGGTIYHNIYGGGAYGTVGDFQYDMREDDVTHTNKVFGILSHTDGTGVARVTITGGNIGYDGKENGMVFGSSRGDINAPGKRDDHAAWVYDTHVTIGTSGSQTGPQINGTVYGSGENGHVFNDTEVTVHSGTIGIYNDTEGTYDITSGGKTYNGAEYPYRGNVYGGGCGTDKYYEIHAEETHDGEGQLYNSLAGIVYGNATVNITGGRVVRNVYGAGAMGSVGKITTTEGVTTIPSGGLTTINISGGTVGVDGNNGDGNVYGAARGNATTTQTDVALVENTSVNISANGVVKGNVYGGGETGDVLGNTEVNVCAEKQTSGEEVTYVVTSGNPTIGGNVYGGGKGIANSFTCAKAMVGIVDQGVTGTGTEGDPYVPQPGGTTVRIYNGTVKGNVYGGGEIARVERNTAVIIGEQGNTNVTPTIQGSVFAAGAGIETHGYSALVRGTSTVTVQGSAQVWKNVFGGGEKASVGRYKVKTPANSGDKDVPATLPLGMPARLLAGGTSTVNIQGSAEIGIDSDANTGHVYGAGQGVGPSWTYTEYTSNDTPYSTRIKNSKRMVNYTSSTAHPVGKQYKEWDYYIDENGREDQNYVWEYFPTESAYLQFIESLAISAETYVTIGGKRNLLTGEITSSGAPTIWGSVFGGSESGFVYRNTDVKIQGGTVNGDAFGGGRGLESFAEAGRVGWNTTLAISGGTVKGNVYGGGNLGDVGTINKSDQTNHNYVWKNTDSNGNNMDPDNNNTAENNSITGTNKNTGICTVTISGGMIGVDNPADATKQGNVFGASQGSGTTYWCEKATVFATNVTITDGIVKGNVYGGGEIGRVEDDTKVTIGTGLTGDESGNDNHPTITGNVFGAGAGKETHGYSALVRGNCITTVQGTAKVEKNVYGGGEKATAGKYWISKFVPEPGNPAPEGMPDGMPYKTRGGGKCYVTVKDNAQIGPNGGATEFDGHLFGAGKGVTPAYYYDPANTGTKENWSKRMTTYNASTHVSGEGTTWDYYPEDSRFVWEYFTTEAKYLEFLQTLALATETHVTVQGNATVMGTVYGGSDSGFVQDDTEVNILGQSKIGKDDAHSYSNIFGGGKGHETFHEAGMVKGNTKVNAFGGEIWGSVFGGGAMSKVVGSTNVNIGKPYEPESTPEPEP